MNKSRMYKIIRSNEEVKTDLSYIGGVIKRRRIEKNLTQESIARGICSISYLSKIENSRMKPDPLVIEEVSKRVGIYFDKKVSERTLQKYIENVYTLFFYNQAEDMENYLESHPIDHFFLIDGMIRYLIAIKRGDHALSMEYRSILKPLFNTMPKDLQLSFVVALIIDHYQTHEFNEAFNHARLIEDQNLPVDMMAFLYHYYCYMSYANVNRFDQTVDHYMSALALIPKLNHSYYFNALYLESEYHKMRLNPYYELSGIESYLMTMPAKPLINKINVMIMKNAIKNNDFEKLDLIPSDTMDESFYHLAYLKCIYLNESQEVFEKALPYYAKPYQVMVHLHQFDNSLERIEYIKSVAIPTMKNHENIEFLDVLFDEIVNYYSEHSRYKEAIALIKKRYKIMSKIQSFERIQS